MSAPRNPADFDVDRFSPPTSYRETSIDEIVDHLAGPEPQAKVSYEFTGRVFVELQPYDDEPSE